MDSEEERFTVLGAIGLRRGGLLPGGGLKWWIAGIRKVEAL